MAISDKTRKMLWGQAGARCSICQCSLIMSNTNSDDEAIVGDECHIYARHKGGARYNPSLSADMVDEYDNLILLCKTHHKMIDDQLNRYTAHYLIRLKSRHELWVNANLQSKKNASAESIAIGIDNASDVVRIIGDCEAYDFQHDELETETEVETVASFLQDLQDYMYIHSDMEIVDRTKFSFHVKQQMQELDQLGFAVFIARNVRTFGQSGHTMDFAVASLRVVRKTNPNIQAINLNDLQNILEEPGN